ncbi:MAG: acyltransferase [Campylobacterota bacterium]|nr:acyltransferase [Campylobacterota bacterium]
MKLRPSQSLHNIQMLRAVAAIMVVMHHALPTYQAMGETLSTIDIVSKWGFAGVDIFFVISGFIMAYTTFNKERSLLNAKTFFKHRLFRIYLGYWPFFFVMLAALFMVNPQKLSSLDIVGSFFLTNVDMFQLVLPISWSLSYELYFYLLFLLTFFFSIKQLYLFIPILTLFIVSIVVIVFLNHGSPQSFFWSPFILEFFAGVLLYMYRDSLMKYWIVPLGLLMIIFAYGYGISHDTKNGLYRVLTFGTGALFVVLVALILEEKHLYVAGRKMTLLGDASYTLYLSHLIIIQLFYHSGMRAFFTSDCFLLPLIGWAVLLSISTLFSIIYYQKIEKPIYKKAINL